MSLLASNSIRVASLSLALSVCAPATAQDLPPGYLDPGPILRAAAEAIGVTNLGTS